MLNETNSELEEMDTCASRDEAYERTQETISIDEFAEPAYEYDFDYYEYLDERYCE